MLRKLKYAVLIFCILKTASAFANLTVLMNFTDPKNSTQAGDITIKETKYGLLFIPSLHHLTPGIRGFHIHENFSCENQGNAAGGHLDPAKSAKHSGPYIDTGHVGDLPALYVEADGTSTLPVLSTRIKKLSQIRKRTLMIHEGGDNYSDTPEKLGGGHGRMICGLIK